ncbi:Uncharacterised protein [uncultured archaeon]|nr:Uncharacterised protein [uncultured archaeon]
MLRKQHEDKLDKKIQNDLAAGVVGGVGGGLILSSKVLTGAATANSMRPTAYLGIILLVIGVLAGFLYIKREKKKLKVKVKKTSKKKRK